MLSGAPLVPPCEFENLFHSTPTSVASIQLLCCITSVLQSYSNIFALWASLLNWQAFLPLNCTLHHWHNPSWPPSFIPCLEICIKLPQKYAYPNQVGSLPISVYFTPLESALKSIKSVSKSSPFAQFIFYIFKTYWNFLLQKLISCMEKNIASSFV